ncbi:MAG: sigma-70 family RNA polymerase sigma factor, partial [Sedimentisphaerales bacterium]|nr:sigma-70 family RNA polymerase sigma factor [Sedimentisphaerales bacterium]
MSEITQAEKYLLDQIRQGRPEGWSQLIERYQGRLLAFARSRLPQRADAEDVVQETFLAFLKTLSNFRGEASLETWLFTILRRKIIDIYRSQRSKVTCLLQDVYKPAEGDSRMADPFSQMAAPDPTASWYVRRDEQYHLQREALTGALRELVDGFKKSLNFRDLQIVEMLFYCHLSNKDVAGIMGMSEKAVALIKHRSLKQIRKRIESSRIPIGPSSEDFENLMTDVWK